jgi:hypothetical protein
VPCLAVWLSGCASFRHQADPSEPHGIVHVVKQDPYPNTIRRLVEVDRHPVRQGLRTSMTLRLPPGEHVLVFRETRTLPSGQMILLTPEYEETGKAFGMKEVNAAEPRWMWTPNWELDEGIKRAYRIVEVPLVVEPGHRYELNGYTVEEQPLQY